MLLLRSLWTLLSLTSDLIVIPALLAWFNDGALVVDLYSSLRVGFPELVKQYRRIYRYSGSD